MDPSARVPVHVTVPSSPEDPRAARPMPPGVVVHHTPPLHPDDVTVVDGIPCTSVARTIVDCAEEMSKDELRELVARAERMGLLDVEAVRRSAARVEWRPSLPMLHEVLDAYVG
jgi:hypothetical protein